MSDEQPAAPKPLSLDKWARLHQLIDFVNLTPEQHAEASDLHAQAKAFADSWQPDIEAAKTHAIDIADAGALALRQIAALIPSAAGISFLVARFDEAVDKLKAAVLPPKQPPELPPPPEPEPAPEPAPPPPAADPQPEPALPPLAAPELPAEVAETLNLAEADQNAVSASSTDTVAAAQANPNA